MSNEKVIDAWRKVIEGDKDVGNMEEVNVNLTLVTGEKVTIPYGEHSRCCNCGKSEKEAKGIITGGEICETEWACCDKCCDEMVEKGCAFEELGDMTYRQQKY